MYKFILIILQVVQYSHARGQHVGGDADAGPARPAAHHRAALSAPAADRAPQAASRRSQSARERTRHSHEVLGRRPPRPGRPRRARRRREALRRTRRPVRLRRRDRRRRDRRQLRGSVRVVLHVEAPGEERDGELAITGLR